MRTGQSGQRIISWTQTEVDGLESAPLSFLTVGAAWSWRGQATMVENPADFSAAPDLDDATSGILVLTNGAQQFTANLFAVAGEDTPSLVFDGECPAREQEFWISAYTQIDTRKDTATGMENTVVAFPMRQLADGGWDTSRRLPAANAGRAVD